MKTKISILQTVRYSVLLFFIISAPFFNLRRLPYVGTILLLIYILGGAFFCGWMCPLGALEDFMSVVASKLRIKQKNILPRKLHLMFLPMRYIIFVLFMFGVGFMVFAVRNMDARRALLSLLNQKIPQTIAVISLFLFLTVSLFYKRVFCIYFCYEGVQFGLRNIFRIFTVQRDNKKCVSCKECDNVCVMSINVSSSDDIKSTQCVNCFKCISSCRKKNAMKYGLINAKNTILGIYLFKNKEMTKNNKILCYISQIVLLTAFSILVYNVLIYLRNIGK